MPKRVSKRKTSRRRSRESNLYEIREKKYFDKFSKKYSNAKAKRLAKVASRMNPVAATKFYKWSISSNKNKGHWGM